MQSTDIFSEQSVIRKWVMSDIFSEQSVIESGSSCQTFFLSNQL